MNEIECDCKGLGPAAIGSLRGHFIGCPRYEAAKEAMNQLAREHEFIRYVQRMVGRRGQYQALCSCKWLGRVTDRSTAWAEWHDHRHEESQLLRDGSGFAAAQVMAGLKQALTGQEP